MIRNFLEILDASEDIVSGLLSEQVGNVVIKDRVGGVSELVDLAEVVEGG